MANIQPPEKLTNVDSALVIREIFQTIQCEGPFSGTPAIFIRLAGCNLQCPLCDTDYTKNRYTMKRNAILSECKKLSKSGLIVITGGEPFRQRRIGILIAELLKVGYYIQIESNGTIMPPVNFNYNKNYQDRKGVYLVVSPKTDKINPTAKYIACAFKYVVNGSSYNHIDGLPVSVLGHPIKNQVCRPPEDFPKHQIYIQPADECDEVDNKSNIAIAIQNSMQFGYTLQLQLHKILNLR